MKAVLVIDIPNDIDISKLKIGGDGNIYYIRDGERASIVGNIKNIKPLPQKVEMDFNEYYEGMADGWNACIDEIIGDNDDEV